MNFLEIQQWLSLATQVTLLAGVVVSIIVQLRTHANVMKVELATNSMKDALVKATGEASGLAGEKRGREQAERERSE